MTERQLLRRYGTGGWTVVQVIDHLRNPGQRRRSDGRKCRKCKRSGHAGETDGDPLKASPRCYFDNDDSGFAPKNALRLKELLA
jgi:uncharacterized protein YecE (DUF72 family)